MSIEYINRVWKLSKHKGSALLVLLAIANVADEKGMAFPGMDYLSKQTRMSKPYVRIMVDRIIESGELVKVHKGGNGFGDSNRYKIVIKHDASRVLPASPNADESRGNSRGGLGEEKGRRAIPDTLEPLEPLDTSSGGSGFSVEGLVGSASLMGKHKASLVKHGNPQRFVAHVLYGATQKSIKRPALWATTRLEDEPSEPFKTLGQQSPDVLAEVLTALRNPYGATNLNGLTDTVLAFRGWFDMTEKELVERASLAMRELGLTMPPPTTSVSTEPEPDDEPIPAPVVKPITEWQKVLAALKVQTTGPNFRELESTRGELVGQTLRVLAHDPQRAAWIDNRLGGTIRRVATEVLGFDVVVEVNHAH